MKCAFKFPVKWGMSIDSIRPFAHDGWNYEFGSKDGCVTEITVTVPVLESDALPVFSPTPNEKGAFNLQVNLPACAGLLMRSLRTLEGFLSIYGLEAILLDETAVSWIAETAEEKRKIDTSAFSFKFNKPTPPDFPLPYSVISRSIAASKVTLDWEIPLSFYRKGRLDFLERRYVDAIYDFYLMLETLFGGGKTKNASVAEEFKKMPSLLKFIEQVLKDGEQSIIKRGTSGKILEAFRTKYKGKSAEQYIDTVVMLRGFLHHHSARNKNAWNPSKESEQGVRI